MKTFTPEEARSKMCCRNPMLSCRAEDCMGWQPVIEEFEDEDESGSGTERGYCATTAHPHLVISALTSVEDAIIETSPLAPPEFRTQEKAA